MNYKIFLNYNIQQMSSKKTIDELVTINSTSVITSALTVNGALTTGTNSMTTGAITSSSAFSNGTNSMTSGVISCTNLISTSRSQVWSGTATKGSGGGVWATSYTSPTSTPSQFTGILTYARDSVNGDTWTINQAGLYMFTINSSAVTATGIVDVGISRNTSATTALTSWTPTNTIGLHNFSSTNDENIFCHSFFGVLAANDVIRCCYYGTTVTSIGTANTFTITYICGTQ